MFTGIVREVGRVVSFDGRRLVLDAETQAAVGDSVSVDGVCLTAVDGSQLAFDVVDETLARTTLGSLGAGDRVNLEPALRAGDPLGGHIVQGHVDGLGRVRSTGEPVWIDAPLELLRYCVEKGSITVDGVSLTVAAVDEQGFARVVTVEADPGLLRYVVEKGSIAVDGVSLTVAAVDDATFAVSLIPETLERTNLGTAAPGTVVNLEVDILAKYVEKLLGARTA